MNVNPTHQQGPYDWYNRNDSGGEKIPPQNQATSLPLTQSMGDCRGQTITFADGSKYTGEVNENGEPHGRGVLDYPDTQNRCKKYEGEFADGLFHGKGIMLYINGRKYDGDWVKGLRQGKGNEETPIGDVYVGDFANDKRHGKGYATTHRNETVIGEFEDGRFIKGTIIKSQNEKFEGEFRNSGVDLWNGVYSRNGEVLAKYKEGKETSGCCEIL